MNLILNIGFIFAYLTIGIILFFVYCGTSQPDATHRKFKALVVLLIWPIVVLLSLIKNIVAEYKNL